MCSTILPDLPRELIYNIIIRLPVKDIIRFSCVSKVWNHVVRSRGFIKEHHEHSTMNSIHNCTLIRLTNKDEFYSAVFSNDTFGQQKQIKPHPLYSVKERNRLGLRSRVVAKYNGLILLQVQVLLRKKYYLVLWNPTIAKHRRIPYEFEKHKRYHRVFGVGYDSDADDSKVFTLEQRCNNFAQLSDLSTELKVYSLASGTWETIKLELPYHNLLLIRTPVVLMNNSRVAWVMKKVASDYEAGRHSIVTFDLVRKEFHGFPLPRPFKNFVRGELVVLGGLLSIWYENWVWIMKEEYSWTKLHSLLFSSAQPLLFDGDRGRVLLKVELSNGGARLEWFTLKTGEMTKIDGCCTLPGSGVHVCEGNIRLLLDGHGHPDGKHGYLW